MSGYQRLTSCLFFCRQFVALSAHLVLSYLDMAMNNNALGVVGVSVGAYVASQAFVASQAAQAPARSIEKPLKPLKSTISLQTQPDSHVPFSRMAGVVGMVGMAGGIRSLGKPKRTTKTQKVQLQAEPRLFDGWAHCEQYKEEMIATVEALTMPGWIVDCTIDSHKLIL